MFKLTVTLTLTPTLPLTQAAAMLKTLKDSVGRNVGGVTQSLVNYHRKQVNPRYHGSLPTNGPKEGGPRQRLARIS